MTTIDPDVVRKAAEIICAGGLVAMPTETVYGLAADAANDRAVARIFEAKGRPQFNPLIIHVAGPEMAARYVEISPLAKKLMDAFWPGPLTLVLPRRAQSDLSLLVSAGLDTVGVRAPKHDLAQALIAAADRPLAAPSANRSGTISPTTAAHVREGDFLTTIDMILDGGPCPVGVESTIVKVDDEDAILLRPGGVPAPEIEAVIGAALQRLKADAKPQAPGMIASHYAPGVDVRLNRKAPEGDAAFLGFGKATGEDAPAFMNLSPSGDLTEAAANLFAYLRALDDECQRLGLNAIAVAPIPAEGLGEAINDRLRRAAARRRSSLP